MIRLEKIVISGFKSFCGRTEVRFPAGVTAVVGPNGCGKSNIGDAINWALGEQSPKLLRGKQMADVIFNGTTARKPLGLAEVSLHFNEAEGLRHQDQGRIAITRRLFRSGDSEYLINGKRTRLKDIQELLHDARVGARTYATIEQGRIDQILNAKPKDRRLLIEDAAGVAGYKHKRRLTELKLEATQANLLRVNDIVVEVERQIRSLKRQASRARRYRRLRDELREKEQIRFGVRAMELDAELTGVKHEERKLRDAEAEASAGLARLEVELTEERSDLDRANEAFRRASERLHQLELEIDRKEGGIRACRERITESDETAERESSAAATLGERHVETSRRDEAQRALVERQREELERVRARFAERQAALEEAERLHRAEREAVEELRRALFESMNLAAEQRNQLRGTQEALERNTAQRARLEAEQSGADADRFRLRGESETLAAELERQGRLVFEVGEAAASCEQALRRSRERLVVEERALADSRETEKSAAARLHTLEDVSTRFAAVSDGVRTLLSAGHSAGLHAHGVVADLIQARTDMEGVAEGYLEGFLPTVILEEDSDVRRAADLLRAEGAGRTNLIARSQPAGRPAVGVSSNGRGELPLELFDDPRVQGRLSEGLTLRSSANGVLQDRVGEAVLVESLEAGLALHRRFPTVDFLTPQGDVVYASGVVSAGGRRQGDRGLLAHNRQIDEARSQLGEASTRVAMLQERAENCRAEVERLELELHDHRQRAEAASRRQVELEVQSERSAEESTRSERRTEVLAEELAGLVAEATRLTELASRLNEEVGQAESAHRATEEALRARIEAAGQREETLRRVGSEAGDLRAELAALLQRQESAELEQRRTAEAADELEERVRAAGQAAAAARQRSADAAYLLARTEEELLGHLEESKRLQARTGEMERQIAERQRLLAEREKALRSARTELENRREATREKELERTRCEEARRHLDDLCAQELGLSGAQAAAAVAGQTEEVDLEALETEVARLRAAIEKVGPVNMTAIEEFSELEERHAFLTAQRQDLEQSMASLRDTIRRINRTSRERFAQAFDAIRLSYQEIFQVLFNGGRADLRLEEGEDVLEAGVEILAQPPGKRLGSIQLLSGGEKALCAIALLFAVFRFQPSPFCLLDEVDAALDDSNVGRFTRMIGQYSKNTQFILITHNKLSMESAGLLYGVTMEEPGVSQLVSMELH
jgi:chromosome segregation protein